MRLIWQPVKIRPPKGGETALGMLLTETAGDVIVGLISLTQKCRLRVILIPSVAPAMLPICKGSTC